MKIFSTFYSRQKQKEMSNNVDLIWKILSENSNSYVVDNLMVDLILENKEQIGWVYLSGNSSDDAVNLLLENRDKIDWDFLSTNTNERIVDLLLERPDKINFRYLSKNSNDRAVDLLLQNTDKINYAYLSYNSNKRAIHLLHQKMHQKKGNIRWSDFLINSNNCVLDLFGIQRQSETILK
jgi:hypothetical protein